MAGARDSLECLQGDSGLQVTVGERLVSQHHIASKGHLEELLFYKYSPSQSKLNKPQQDLTLFHISFFSLTLFWPQWPPSYSLNTRHVPPQGPCTGCFP